MYPSTHTHNHKDDQHYPSIPQHIVQPHPHPLNRNFRFPLSVEQTAPQRSASQPHPQGQRPSVQLNPEASTFSFRPQVLEVSSPLDNGLGRLKRYHDDPSGLGADYTLDSSTSNAGVTAGAARTPVLSPRKAALAQSLGLLQSTPPYRTMSPPYRNTLHLTSPSISREPPPHLIRTHRPGPSLSTVPAYHAGSHVPTGSIYWDAPSTLGICRPYHASWVQEHRPQLIVPPASFNNQTPPRFNRSKTRSKTFHSSRGSISLSHSQASLPLTLSPQPHSFQGHSPLGTPSPAASIASAPFDIREGPGEGRQRVVSLSPSYLNKREREDPERRYRGFRGREGGPPKAILGGAGGKTFDELLAERIAGGSSPSSNPTSDKQNELNAEISLRKTSDSTPGELKWKGNPITVKLPPERYSPPDSPPRPLPVTEEGKTDTDAPSEPTEVLPRREAYPWPPHQVRLSPTGVPLPLSPHEPGEDTARHPSISSTIGPEENRAGIWKGKEVLVSVPAEGCWEKLRPPTPPTPITENDLGPEDEVSTLLQAPPSDQGDMSDSKSIDMVEDNVPLASPREKNDVHIKADSPERTAWDQWPVSPVKDGHYHERQAEEKDGGSANVSPILDGMPVKSKMRAWTPSPPASPSSSPSLSSSSRPANIQQSNTPVDEPIQSTAATDKSEPGRNQYEDNLVGTELPLSSTPKARRSSPAGSAQDIPHPPSKLRAWGPSPSPSATPSMSDDQSLHDQGEAPTSSPKLSRISGDKMGVWEGAPLPSTENTQDEDMQEKSENVSQALEAMSSSSASSEIASQDIPVSPASPTVHCPSPSSAAERITSSSSVVPEEDRMETQRSSHLLSSPVAEDTSLNATHRVREWTPSPLLSSADLDEESSSKMRAWGSDDFGPSERKTEKRNRDDEGEDDRWVHDKSIPHRSEDMKETKRKAMESQKTKRSARVSDEHAAKAAVRIQRDVSLMDPILEERRRRVIESRVERGTAPMKSKVEEVLENDPSSPSMATSEVSVITGHGQEGTAQKPVGTTPMPAVLGVVVSSRDLDPPTPEAKRLRPTAEPWQPPSVQQVVLPIRRLRPTAQSWRPRQSSGVSLDSMPPSSGLGLVASSQYDGHDHLLVPQPIAANVAPKSILAGSRSFTWNPLSSTPPIIHNSAPFIPRSTTFSWPPPSIGPIQRHQPPSVITHKPSRKGLNTSENKLRPTASAFVPPTREDQGRQGQFTFAFRHVHSKSASPVNTGIGHAEPKLRPTAVEFVPPQRVVSLPNEQVTSTWAHSTPAAETSSIGQGIGGDLVISASATLVDVNSQEGAYKAEGEAKIAPSRPISEIAHVAPIDPALSPSINDKSTAAKTNGSPPSPPRSIQSKSARSPTISLLSGDPHAVKSYPSDEADDPEPILTSQELFRVTSRDEPILSPAEIRFEQRSSPQRKSSQLAVSPYGRGRADTAAFGPRHAQSREGCPSSDVDTPDSPPIEQKTFPQNVNFDSLFVDAANSDDPSSLMNSPLLAWREEASPLPAPDSGAASDSESSAAHSSRTRSEERITRSSRAPSLRHEENSYRPKDLPPLPLTEAVIPLDEVTIHPSHPFQLPRTPVRSTADDLPDVPVSGHTHTHGLSASDATLPGTDESNQQTQNARSALARPLPPIPSSSPGKDGENVKGMNPSAKAFVFASPARVDETPPQSTGETYSSAAYMTADGSPLVPQRTLDELTYSKPFVPLPDIPTWREPLQEAIVASHPERLPESSVFSDHEVEVLEDDTGDSSDDDELLMYPGIDSRGRTRHPGGGFDRSTALSPAILSESELSDARQPVGDNHENSRPVADTRFEEEQEDDTLGNHDIQDKDHDHSYGGDLRFREWTYPLSVDVDGADQTAKPSIIRRHTMLDQADMDDLEPPPSTLQSVSVASTFATRVGALRAVFKHPESGVDDEGVRAGEVREEVAGEDTSRRTSVEFPLRDEHRVLGVVNSEKEMSVSTPDRQSDRGVPSPQVLRDARLDEVLELLRGQAGLVKGGDIERSVDEIRGLLMETVQGVLTRPQETTFNTEVAKKITSVLEEHSRLLSSLHDAVSQPTAPPASQAISEEGLAQNRSQELFAAILTGQHAILEKFDQVTSSRLSGSEEPREAIDSLKSAQVASEATSSTMIEQERLIASLRADLADSHNAFATSRAEADVLNQRLRDTRQDRDDVRRELESFQIGLEDSRSRQRNMEGDLDGVVTRALAAELERDALARSVGTGRDTEDSLRAELHEWREELEKQKEESRLALAEKESEVVSIQAMLQAHLSAQREQEQAKESERQRELKKENTQTDSPATISALVELSQTTVSFQEEVVNRFSKLDELMLESMESRVKEYESVLDRNRILQGEVDGLRARLEASADRFAKLQLSTAEVLSKSEIDLQNLQHQLQSEREKGEESDNLLEQVKAELEELKVEKMNMRVILAEREAMARMNEVRFQALTQENVYWRQFALEHDRRRFKSYLSTQPFKGFETSSDDRTQPTVDDRPYPGPTPGPGPQDISHGTAGCGSQSGTSRSVPQPDQPAVVGSVLRRSTVGHGHGHGHGHEQGRESEPDAGILRRDESDGGVWYDVAKT